jgi:hypothetical protein
MTPKFIMEKFAPGTLATVWFRATGTALRGRVVEWVQDVYVVFEMLTGSRLYLPYGDIHLATLSEARWKTAQAEVDLEDRLTELKLKMGDAQLRQQESGLASPH